MTDDNYSLTGHLSKLQALYGEGLLTKRTLNNIYMTKIIVIIPKYYYKIFFMLDIKKIIIVPMC